MPYIIQSSTDVCVFWCSTFAYSVRFVLYSLIGCVITALLIQKSEFGYTPIRQSAEPFQVDDSIAPLIGRSLTSSTVGLVFVIMLSPASYLSLSFQHSKIQLRHQELMFSTMPVETSFSPSVSYHFKNPSVLFALMCVSMVSFCLVI